MNTARASAGRAHDDIRPLFRVMVGLGVAALVILAIGLIEFLAFEPSGQATGIQARIVSVQAYDPQSGRTLGPSSSHFARDQPFAAVVDWGSLPPDLQVGARWYNSLGQVVGSAGPAPASRLGGLGTVPIRTPPGQRLNGVGRYHLLVERFSGGRPVEILAGRYVVVEAGS